MPASKLPARAVARELAAWYRRHARDLPWRRDPTAYHVLVSEFMLQQTTVEAVLPYYVRFMERFPDLESLAAAREEEVLGLWSGLGYYRRARSLLAAAREIVAGHGGRVPSTRGKLVALPGIGPYTASAILAIAHGRRAIALDGNLKRVLSRLTGHTGDVDGPDGASALTALALPLLDGAPPALVNQALMDLGAAVCTPRAPACAACPLEGLCAARSAGMEGSIPVPRRRREAIDVRIAAAILRRRGSFLMKRREARLMRGLWEFPMAETGRGGVPRAAPPPGRRDPVARVRRALAGEIARAGLSAGRMSAVGELTHSITHHRIRVEVYEVASAGGGRLRARRDRPAAEEAPARSDLAGEGPGEWSWIERADLAEIPLGGIARKILRLLEREEAGRSRARAVRGGRRRLSPRGSGRASSARRAASARRARRHSAGTR